MRKFWMNSIPVLAVLFVLAFGFASFHILTQNAEATGTDCTYQTAQCATEAGNIVYACHNPPVNQQRCENAHRDYEVVCEAASEACNDS